MLVLQPEWPSPCVWDVHQGFLGMAVRLYNAPALLESTGSSALRVLPRSTHKTPRGPREPCCPASGEVNSTAGSPSCLYKGG